MDALQTRLGSFRRDDRRDVPCLVVDGDIDDRLVEDFTDAIFKTIIDAHGLAVLDLTGVTYFGSNGIGALITGKALSHDHGVELRIDEEHRGARQNEFLHCFLRSRLYRRL